MALETARRRSRRLELRTTPEERELIERAVAATGTDLTEFVVGQASEAARRVLADRTRFELSERAATEWEAINARPARDLPGLRKLMSRPSPFA
ncbi:MAG: type II toxin-antitoxin system TacA family antitoxin [Mycobacteriales bacterium]